MGAPYICDLSVGVNKTEVKLVESLDRPSELLTQSALGILLRLPGKADSVNGGTVSNLLKMLGFVLTLSFGVEGYERVRQAGCEDSAFAFFSR
jgi:hypothetical protein